MPVTVHTPSDRAVVVTREFAAPPELVFAAWTEPVLLRRWYGAHGWDLVVTEVDLRIGGAWRFVWRGPDGAGMASEGVYREIEPVARLVYTESYDDHWYHGECLVSHDFTETGGRTTLTSTILYESRRVRDQALATPMARGMEEGYVRLDGVLAVLLGGLERGTQ
ncbi:ATPase [Spongiactinospora rosea]|uniref:ATPase n=1 Tax=Spongiactinospora rosea TaxID=2248750 RepID=A0A366LY82_9ACTN|nr:SRPBCC family protein [Spongiactinospora rosea]RBQ18737.1 ATPase [Spongiactinospora rosea]